jgi:hypothetical protein
MNGTTTEVCCGNPKCDGVGCKKAEQAITRDQAAVLVGRHMLVVLEDVIAAHQLVLDDPTATEVSKANAQLVIAAAQGFGRPLFQVVKVAERPRILRPQRSIRVVR